MTAENTRAALPGDLVARLRDASITAAARGRDELDAEVYHACMDAADALAARDAEIARLRAALELQAKLRRSYIMRYCEMVVRSNRMDRRIAKHRRIITRLLAERPKRAARAALSPPPASDGGEP